MISARTLVGLICVTLTLALASEAAAGRRRRPRRRLAGNRLLLQAAQLGRVSQPAVRKEAPPPRKEHDDFVLASLNVQGDVRYSPTSLGFALSYQHRLSDAWRLAAGASVGLRSNRTLVEPGVGLEVVLLSFGSIDLHAQGGLAAPIQLMADTFSVAAAGRLEAGLRWSALDWLSPQAGVALVLGPILTPSNVRWETYGAFQLTVGARFGL